MLSPSSIWLIIKSGSAYVSSSLKVALKIVISSISSKRPIPRKIISQLYIYMPLQHKDSIRVVVLHPGERPAPLRISLREIRLEDAPHYEALSYTWATEDGDASLSQEIDCDGTIIRITKSCEAALRRLREENHDRVVWVDAICINQEDWKERGLQVGMMGDVYSKAARVIVWLGMESDEEDPETSRPVSDLYMDHLHRLVSEMKDLHDANQDGRDSGLYRKLVADIYASVTDGTKSQLSQGFNYIQSRRWWSRIWVLQEVVVAKSAIVLCGQKSLEYLDFLVFYGALRKGASSTTEEHVAWLALGTSRKQLSLYPESGSNKAPFVILHRILRQGQNLQATDPRDHAFGLIGFSEDLRRILPEANYDQNLVQVFTAVTKNMLHYSKSLHAICVVTPGESTEGFPSWVTVWSNPMTHNYEDWHDNQFNAAKNSQAQYAIVDNDRELKVFGKIIDMVTVGPLLDPSAYRLHGTLEDNVLGWQESCHNGMLLDSYPTEESVIEAIWRSLCWDHSERKTREDFDQWYRIVTGGHSLQETVELLSALPDAFSRVVNTPSPLCTTRNGYLASAPYTAKVGDCIAVLTGGRAPFVLRPVNNFYQLIGPCYIHGIMNGEAFPDDQDTLQWISIR